MSSYYRPHYKSNYSPKKYYNQKQNKLLELNCPIHGYASHLRDRDKGEAMRIFEEVNEDKTNIVNKCRECLEEEIRKSNEEKERIKKSIDQDKKVMNIILAVLFYVTVLNLLIGWQLLIFLGHEDLAIWSFIGSLILFQISGWVLREFSEGEEKLLKELTTHLPWYTSAEDLVNSKHRDVIVFEKRVLTIENNKVNQESSKAKKEEANASVVASLEIIDTMTGRKFEYYVKILLIANGYENVTVTKASADHGIDIVAYKDYKKIGIQCKRYKNKIGNKAVQEVYSGKDFYDCDEAYIVTNSFFTRNAIEAARKLKVKLIDRKELSSWMESAGK